MAALANRRMALAHGLPDASSQTHPALDQFGYGDVELLEGPMRQQFDTNHAFFLGLNEDSLLKPFRQRAGLPAPGDDMGGWYDNSTDFDPHGSFHGFVPGHSFGQYVSGLARAYAVTDAKPTQAKVQRLVRGFAPTVCDKFYDGYHLPAYTYDKTSCGLIDAHQFAADETALSVLNAATDAVLPHLPRKALSRAEQYALPHKDEAYCWDETYTLPENFFLAYQRGGGARYRDLAIRFLEDDLYFDPLSEGKNVLPGEHAYSHVNAFSSAMQAYLVLGSEKHLRAAQNGFDFVRTQSFVTGGWGPNEAFRKPGSGEIGESLNDTHASFETPCGAYGHFKITRYLLRVTRDSRYGDSMERVLYNTILGAKHLKEDGSSFYYSDYNSHAATKVYHRDKWPCCSGTFPQITADYGISSYFHDSNGVYVNLYTPSRVSWKHDGTTIGLTQRTSYPSDLSTQIEVSTGKPAAFGIYLRIPGWAGPKSTLAVNGKRVSMDLTPGTFARVDRTWKNGDRIEVEFNAATTLEAVDPQHPNVVAPVHGPLVLFAVGALPQSLRRMDLLGAGRISKGSDTWQVRTEAGIVTLKPFASIGDEEYRLYHQVEG
ncbi:MAG: beta-L-arabinofuranosidase domain-containing protein [Terracidiphilus sp.]